MAHWAAFLPERRRTYEGCRDLYRIRSVLAAASDGWRGLRRLEPPSFGPMQEDLRICFGTCAVGLEPLVNHASEHSMLHRKMQLCVAEHGGSRDEVKNRGRMLEPFVRFGVRFLSH